MTELDPIQNDARASRTRRRLPPDAACLWCGETTPEALWLGGSTLIESHHVAGRKNDAKLVAPLCLNCHRKATADQRSVGVDLARSARPHDLRMLVSWLAGVAEFLSRLASSTARFVQILRDHLQALDDHHPDWETTLTEGDKP